MVKSDDATREKINRGLSSIDSCMLPSSRVMNYANAQRPEMRLETYCPKCFTKQQKIYILMFLGAFGLKRKDRQGRDKKFHYSLVTDGD